MNITITISVEGTEKYYDVTVDTSQRIRTTLQVMHENISDFPKPDEVQDIRYGEQMRRILPERTYQQAGIFTGDILHLYTEEAKSSDGILHEEGEKKKDFFQNICREEYKKSEFAANCRVDYENLILEKRGLLDCAYEETEENLIFYYDLYEMKGLGNIRMESKEDQFRFLLNVSMFLECLGQYKVELTESNLYYDLNYMLYGKKRDLLQETSMESAEVYKALIAFVFGKKYGIEDFLSGGTDILENEKWFASYKDLTCVRDIRMQLSRDLENHRRRKRQTKTEVSRKGYLFVKTMLAIVTFAAVVMTGLYFYYGRMVYPLQSALINGEKAFLRKEYVTCIDAMNTVGLESMDQETKYILAVSYARTENLSREEITGIVDQLSLTSGERELEYWICLGRADYQQAQDAAKFLMDDRLLVYAYMKEYDQLESETMISGEEKEQRMEELKGQIEELGEKYTVEE